MSWVRGWGRAVACAMLVGCSPSSPADPSLGPASGAGEHVGASAAATGSAISSSSPIDEAVTIEGDSELAAAALHRVPSGWKPGIPPSAFTEGSISADGRWLSARCGYPCAWGEEQAKRVVAFELPGLSIAADFAPAADDMSGGKVHGARWAGDRHLVTSTHNELSVWQAPSFERVVQPHFNAIYGAWAASPDGRWVLGSDAYGAAALLDLESPRIARSMRLHDGAASMSSWVAFSGDSRVGVVEGNGNVRLVHLDAGIALSPSVVSVALEGSETVSLNEDGTKMIVADFSGQVSLWDTRPTKRAAVIVPPHPMRIPAKAELAPRGSAFVVWRSGEALAAAGGSAFAFYDLDSPTAPVLALEEAPGAVSGRWTPDGRAYVIADGLHGELRAYDSETRGVVQLVAKRNAAPVDSASPPPIAIDSEGRWIAYRHHRSVVVFDRTRNAPRFELVTQAPAARLLFTPDGRFLVALDGDITWLRLADGATLSVRSRGIASQRHWLALRSDGAWSGDQVLADHLGEASTSSLEGAAAKPLENSEVAAAFFRAAPDR